MGIIKSSQFSEGYTPICEECGLTLCWDISEDDYLEYKPFWDTWRCKYCNPNWEGQLKRYKEKWRVAQGLATAN